MNWLKRLKTIKRRYEKLLLMRTKITMFLYHYYLPSQRKKLNRIHKLMDIIETELHRDFY